MVRRANELDIVLVAAQTDFGPCGEMGAPRTGVEKDGCERKAEQKTQCRSTQVKR